MNRTIATLALAAAAVVVVLVFLLLPSPEPTAGPGSSPKPSEGISPSGPSQSTGFDSAEFGPAAGAPQKPSQSASTLPPGAAWEDRLDELLTTEADNATTVRGLVSSMRGLPPEAQEEFVAHAVNLCEDEQFGLLEEIYYSSSTPQGVSETIFNDALNRPDEIKLPMLAKTLRNPAHPMAGEAKEVLEMYLDLEPGTVPPGGWEQAVTTYIKQQGQP